MLAAALRARRAADDTLTITALEVDYGIAPVILSRIENAYKPFDNVNVRKAIALALNRQQIVDLFYPGGSVVATHFTPCSIEFACEGDDWYAQNVDEAKSLLASAGFPNGFKTTLSLRNKVRGYLPDPVGVATEIQSQLKAIGVEPW